MKFTRLLAFRLFLIIFAVMIVGTALFTTLAVQRSSDRNMQSTVKTALQVSDIIKRSTHYGMLLNRREDIYHTITMIGNEPGIEAIRIYNKKGDISFTTIGEEHGKVDMTAEACIACHSENETPLSPNPSELTRIFKSPKGYRVLGMITPIYNEPSCSSGACHAHTTSQTVLGVLDVLLPLQEHDAALAELTREQYMIGLVMVLAVGLFAGVFIWLVVNKPVRKLTLGTQEIMKGNLHHRIPVRSTDEIGVFAESFNHMTGELERARAENLKWTETLERRVEEKTQELRRAQQNMIHVEKMASLGMLAATVAHELNNPLEGVLTYAKLLGKKMSAALPGEDQMAEIKTELKLIADETARCGTIVKNLLLFSRGKIGNVQTEDLRSLIERSTKLIGHHLQMQNVRLDLDVPNEPVLLECDPQQIEQALLALEMNGIEAMPAGGTLKIEVSSPHSDRVRIVVRDTGCGIPPEVMPHIFEPFFTTKETGKGTGLGLSVAYGIVQGHGGSIDVQSLMDVGTTFTVSLPVKQARSGTVESAALQEQD